MSRLSVDLARAAARLREGGIVAFPTETVYGLGADATDPQAVARIYAAKGRPSFNPLIAHVASLPQAEAEANFSPLARRLATRFWPGPLTLVLPRKPLGSVCDLACAGLASIGLRIPAHELALDLMRQVGRPLAAPSANRSGKVSPTRAEDVVSDLGEAVDLVLDGGACRVGLESTIISLAHEVPTLLRPGGIPRDLIEDVVGTKLAEAGPAESAGAIEAPGMLRSHYAPQANVRLEADAIGTDEVGLDFGAQFRSGRRTDLSPVGDLTEAAANLYAALRRLDGLGAATIAVAPIPDNGLGAAINDRLRRAAAPRQLT